MRNIQISRFGRVVKATDLKSVGFARAGSNPAADDCNKPFSHKWYVSKPTSSCEIYVSKSLNFRSIIWFLDDLSSIVALLMI